jgi:plasmid replication initiation protein
MSKKEQENTDNLQMSLDLLPRKAIVLPDKNVKVANEFISAQYKLTLLEFKAFLAITTVYDQKNAKDFYNILKFEFKDLAKSIGLNRETGYTKKLEKILTQLSDAKMRIQKRFDEDEEKEQWIVGHFLSSIEAMGDGTIELVFDPKLIKYFTGLTERYTYLEIQTLLTFSSIYSIRIFNLLKQYKLKKKTYSVEKLKEMLLITDKYKNFSDFKRYVIEPAIKDINVHSTMKVSYETNGMKGKKVTEITFTCVDNFILPNADDKVRKAFEELVYYKINKNVALDIVKKFSFERIENNIKYIITNYPQKNKKKDYPGLIVAAIKENFAGKSWGLESIDEDDVQKDRAEHEKNSQAYDNFIKKIKTEAAAEKIVACVIDNTESTLLLNQLNALKANYKSLELLSNKLFKSIAVPVLKNENFF